MRRVKHWAPGGVWQTARVKTEQHLGLSINVKVKSVEPLEQPAGCVVDTEAYNGDWTTGRQVKGLCDERGKLRGPGGNRAPHALRDLHWNSRKRN